MGDRTVIHLVLGGARSGKSAFAENWAMQRGAVLTYIATAEARDEEMRARIARHQTGRGSEWTLLEEPLALAEAVSRADAPGHCTMVDCLTLWLSNCLERDRWMPERKALFATLGELQGDIVMVSNEVGSGIVPLGELNRRFVDESGRLHQALAARADEVTLTVAGLPVAVKQSSAASPTSGAR